MTEEKLITCVGLFNILSRSAKRSERWDGCPSNYGNCSRRKKWTSGENESSRKAFTEWSKQSIGRIQWFAIRSEISPFQGILSWTIGIDWTRLAATNETKHFSEHDWAAWYCTAILRQWFFSTCRRRYLRRITILLLPCYPWRDFCDMWKETAFHPISC